METEREQREREKRQRIAQHRADGEAVLSTPQGRRFVHWLIKRSGALAVRGVVSAETAQYNNGASEVMRAPIELLSGLESFSMMMNENSKEEK